jgi:Tol biopolymer transport system component
MAGKLDDADLMPLADTILHTPPDYHPSHDQPTPSRPSARVVAPVSWTQPPPRRIRRRPAPLVYLSMALFIGVMIGIVVLAAYILVSRDSEADGPDFAATGVFRLTATAGGVGVARASDVQGQIVYVSDREGQPDLYLLDLTNGNENRLTNTAGAEAGPVVSPDGVWMAYVFDPDSSLTDDGSQSEIFVSRLDGGELRQVTSNLSEENSPTWTPDGAALVYVRTVNGGDSYRIVRYDLTDERESTLHEGSGRAQHPRISADGTSIVFASGEAGGLDSWEIYALNIESENVTQLTDNSEPDWSPCWHPDGSKILFLRTGIGGAALMEMRADGTGQIQIYDGPGSESNPNYTPDGRRILFSSDVGSTFANLFILSAETQIIQQLSFNGGYEAVWLP